MSLTDEQLLNCSLVRWRGQPNGCRWCGRLLRGRQRRWCSADHGFEYARNHSWTEARAAALLRDGYRCTVCGVSDEKAAREWRDVERFVHFATGHRGPLLSYALGSPLRPLRERWLLDHRLEVDHVTPIRGLHSTPGCHHHLDGLRTLCHVHHLQVTAEQFGRVP